jgi:hypothetical protein
MTTPTNPPAAPAHPPVRRFVSHLRRQAVPTFRRLNLPATALLLLLERTPVSRIVSTLTEAGRRSRLAAHVRPAAVTAAALGAVHALAGATQFIVSAQNVYGSLGTPITPVAFTVTGANIPPGSFRITGNLPPGITAANMSADGVINGATGTISGTPTTIGTYTVSLLAYERANAGGDSYGPTLVSFVITATPSAGPTITTQPASQTVAAGATVTLSVAVLANPAPTYQWRKNGTLVPGATGSTLTIPNAQAGDAGSYTVVISNLAGLVTSSPAVVTVDAARLGLTAHPVSQYVAAGATATLAVAANGSGLTYQWQKDGAPLPGATSPTLVLRDAGAATMGFYRAEVRSGAAVVTSAVAAVTVDTGGQSRLTNVSTRGFVPAGGALTPGFVLQGGAPKALVIRAVGPTLGSFGVDGTLADPVLDVIPLGSETATASNDNWGGAAALAAAFSRVGAFALAAAGSSDASVVASLSAAGSGAYTVRITSKSPNAGGVALAEVYDEDAFGPSGRLVNVSTRGFVGTGDQALVPGFFIGGTAPKQVLIRAVGPGLAQFGVTGVLADPQLTLVPLGQDFAVAANDNWGGTAALQAAFTQAGAFVLPASSADAAIVVRLPPGGYTVVVSGVGNTIGTALVEVYDLDR